MTTDATTDPASWQRFEASDLDANPAVNTLLNQLRLGSLDRDAVDAFGGRNDNWAGSTTSGVEVFVKQLPRGEDNTFPGLTRSLAFERAAIGIPEESPLSTPPMLGYDPATGLIVFELLADVRSGVQLSMDGGFDAELCHNAGTAVAVVHSINACDLDETQPWLPPLAWLEAMPWQVVQQYTSAQLASWQLLQNDTEVVDALHALRRHERLAPATPIHGDLRLDQFLIANDGGLYLCDWEQFRRADPARDVGAFVGEWLYHATYSIFMTQKDPAATALTNASFDHEEIITRGKANLRRVIPSIAAFWDGYRSIRKSDVELPMRAMTYAGWHMYDRLIASTESQVQVNPVAKAAAGIGRNMLLNPTGAAELVGLTQPASRGRDD